MSFSESNINFINKQLDRMGIAESDRKSYLDNIYNFSQKVRHIESDNNPKASAKKSTAKGVYQFTDDSVNTAKQRMWNMGFGADVVGNIKDNPHKWSDEQADSMFLANMFAQKGSDDILREVGEGNVEAMHDAYYKFHHTDPDKATKDRVNDFMPIENPVVDTMDSYQVVEEAFTSPEREESRWSRFKDWWN